MTHDSHEAAFDDAFWPPLSGAPTTRRGGRSASIGADDGLLQRRLRGDGEFRSWRLSMTPSGRRPRRADELLRRLDSSDRAVADVLLGPASPASTEFLGAFPSPISPRLEGHGRLRVRRRGQVTGAARKLTTAALKLAWEPLSVLILDVLLLKDESSSPSASATATPRS